VRERHKKVGLCFPPQPVEPKIEIEQEFRGLTNPTQG
jgi:hypothetical protein